jgi:UDP-N-acetylglucosamine 2-epimerase
MRVCTVIGARPQFVKASVVSRAFAESDITETIVHTGQHYDDRMSQVFFDELGIPMPHVNLGVGSGSQANQTGSIMVELERFLIEQEGFQWVLVYGDTNTTLAAAIVAAKLNVPLAHVESGLRSGRRDMPEEVNRIVTDRLSALLFCPTSTAVSNLEREGIRAGVRRCGDVMLEALERFYPERESADTGRPRRGSYARRISASPRS